VGTEVKITGTTFTDASKVTFGGVPATSFEVINDSQVDAIVPKGAKSDTSKLRLREEQERAKESLP
jgi:hypothetical protein